MLRSDGRPSVMAIVNVTPDSFSDGAKLAGPDEAFRYALECLENGADILDIGGESTRPFAQPVPLGEEWRRVAPLLELLEKHRPDALISIDTSKPEIARRAIELGASIVNDVTGCDPDHGMAQVVAETGAAIVIMHMKGTPQTMQIAPEYEDVVRETYGFLADRIRHATESGIAHDRIAVDPGIGFGKTLENNLDILRNLDRFAELGCPVLIGTSRKRMIGELTGRNLDERVAGSVASALFAVCRGASIVRVHDVAATVDALKVWYALEKGNVRQDG